VYEVVSLQIISDRYPACSIQLVIIDFHFNTTNKSNMPPKSKKTSTIAEGRRHKGKVPNEMQKGKSLKGKGKKRGAYEPFHLMTFRINSPDSCEGGPI